ncbi:MAG: ABC transporter substrate-binding protein [Bacillota bacterium]|nr:ABC transporter substrate-binding protein [Bacillota bacterium]
MKYRRLTAIILILLMILPLCACDAFGPVDDYVDGKSAGKNLGQSAAADDVFTLNCNMGYSMNPLIATNTNNQLVCNLVYENMLELDNNYNVVPNIITSWETEDGQRWVFHVDTERYFHDGSKMTAYDLAYSLTCAVSSDRYKGRLNYVYGSSASDEHTLVVNLSKRNMMFPMLMCIPIIKNGSFNDSFPQGTGPYTYSKDYKSLVAFDKYPNYKNLPVDTVYLKEYSGGNDTIVAFEDSLIDVVMNDPTATTNLGYGSSNEIRGYNTMNLHYVGLNALSPVFNYEMMRLVVSYAFDRDYLKLQMGGYAAPTAIPINPSCSWYSESANKEYSYNLDICRNLLKNMSFKDYDQDGYLEMGLGEEEYMEVNIRFLVCSDSSIKANMARKFAQDMGDMGIQVTLLEYGWDEYNAAVKAGNYDMYYGETRINPDFDITKLIATGGSMNFGQWAVPEVDSAISAYLQSDDEGRKQACQDMCNTICGGGYFITLCFEKHQMITHRGVIVGVQVCENNPLMNVQNWTITFDNVADKNDDE